MRDFFPVVVLAVSASIAATTHAETLRSYVVHDAPGLRGFRIEAPGQTDDLCMLYPSQTGNCAGFDVEATKVQLVKAMGGTMAPVAIGMIRTPAGPMFVTVGAIPQGSADMSVVAIDATLRNVQAQFDADPSIRPLAPPQRAQVRGHEAIEASYEQLTDGKVTGSGTTFLLFGRDRNHQLLFEMQSDIPGSAQPLIDHMLTTLDYTPGDLGAFGHPAAAPTSEGGTSAFWSIGVVSLLAAGAWFWWRRTGGRTAGSDGKDSGSPVVADAPIRKTKGKRKRLKLRVELACPHCEATSDQFQQVQDALICPTCGRSFQRESE